MDREQAELRKQAFQAGDRVRIVRWATENSSVDEKKWIPHGTEGTVLYVDDFGTVHCQWDTGGNLGAVLEDEIRKAWAV